MFDFSSLVIWEWSSTGNISRSVVYTAFVSSFVFAKASTVILTCFIPCTNGSLAIFLNKQIMEFGSMSIIVFYTALHCVASSLSTLNSYVYNVVSKNSSTSAWL